MQTAIFFTNTQGFVMVLSTLFATVNRPFQDINGLDMAQTTRTGLDPIFVIRAASALLGTDPIRCWKHFPQILIHIDMIEELLDIYQQHIRDVNLPLHHLLKALYWVKMW